MLIKKFIKINKKVMCKTEYQHIRCAKLQLNTSIMHNLYSNFDKFFNITKSMFKNNINQFDNFFCYHNRPKMSNCEIITMVVTGESLGSDSESYFWGKLKNDHSEDFPNLIDHGNFNLSIISGNL